MKYVHLVIAICFILFGLMQYNDPDFFIWIPIYFFVAFLAYSEFKRKYYPVITIVVTLMLGIWLVTYIPSFISWIKDGMPSVVTSMKAETPYIEHVREFGGLFISFMTTLLYFFLSKKKQNDKLN